MPVSPPLAFDDRSRRLRLFASTLLAAVLLAAASGALVTHLTRGAVEERLHAELMRTAGLLGGRGFPLNDAALERVSDYVQADLVAVDGRGRILATNLDRNGRHAFAAALAEGALPPAPDDARVAEGRLGPTALTVGTAPFEGRPGGVYILYPERLLTQQSRAAWIPVAGVAALAALLAVGLGMWSERLFQRARNAALLRLLAAVGHEVRNPLGAIRSLAQSLARARAAPADREALDLIAAEAERLTYLVEGLRGVGLPLRVLHRAVDPDEAVATVVRLMEAQLRHRRVRVVHRPGASARVLADPAHLRQVVLNLLLNAADAMPRGGEVRLSSRLEDDRWVLDVEDEGPGVSPEIRQRLFGAFVSSKPKGLGVGLFLSRRLVAAYGGNLDLDEGYREGARFTVSWPRAPHAPVARPVEACPES
ncbi:MAG: sensor histidine kinase [Planctomycetota bacterium]|nr:MAG: sensor histidine kinase [Planctomycetota bacterium]